MKSILESDFEEFVIELLQKQGFCPRRLVNKIGGENDKKR